VKPRDAVGDITLPVIMTASEPAAEGPFEFPQFPKVPLWNPLDQLCPAALEESVVEFCLKYPERAR